MVEAEITVGSARNAERLIGILDENGGKIKQPITFKIVASQTKYNKFLKDLTNAEEENQLEDFQVRRID